MRDRPAALGSLRRVWAAHHEYLLCGATGLSGNAQNGRDHELHSAADTAVLYSWYLGPQLRLFQNRLKDGIVGRRDGSRLTSMIPSRLSVVQEFCHLALRKRGSDDDGRQEISTGRSTRIQTPCTGIRFAGIGEVKWIHTISSAYQAVVKDLVLVALPIQILVHA